MTQPHTLASTLMSLSLRDNSSLSPPYSPLECETLFLPVFVVVFTFFLADGDASRVSIASVPLRFPPAAVPAVGDARPRPRGKFSSASGTRGKMASPRTMTPNSIKDRSLSLSLTHSLTLSVSLSLSRSLFSASSPGKACRGRRLKNERERDRERERERRRERERERGSERERERERGRETDRELRERDRERERERVTEREREKERVNYLMMLSTNLLIIDLLAT